MRVSTVFRGEVTTNRALLPRSELPMVLQLCYWFGLKAINSGVDMSYITPWSERG
jgi:hypothetical protein